MDEKLDIKYGYFIHSHHDLYGGILYYGVFDNADEAKKQSEHITCYDEIHIIYCPYVELNGNIYALWENTACKNKEKLS